MVKVRSSFQLLSTHTTAQGRQDLRLHSPNELRSSNSDVTRCYCSDVKWDPLSCSETENFSFQVTIAVYRPITSVKGLTCFFGFLNQVAEELYLTIGTNISLLRSLSPLSPLKKKKERNWMSNCPKIYFWNIKGQKIKVFCLKMSSSCTWIPTLTLDLISNEES